MKKIKRLLCDEMYGFHIKANGIAILSFVAFLGWSLARLLTDILIFIRGIL